MADSMERLIDLIAEIGKIPRVAPDDDIYDAGFTSMVALELLYELEEAFNVTIPDDNRFPAARTPRALHDLIQELAR